MTVPEPNAPRSAAGFGIMPGFGGLFRKELTEWRRGRRTWVVLFVVALFMALSALNSWLVTNLTPPGGVEGAPEPVLDPTLNLLTAVASQIFVVAAIFAVMGTIVAERESGTLAWTASKPVSRSAVWLAKATAAIAVLWLIAGLIPLAATVAVVTALYGGVSLVHVAFIALGMGLSITFFVVVALAAATAVPNQAAVAAIALGVMFLPQLVGLVLPAEVLPTSILEWTFVTAAGQPAGVITPLAWAASLVIIGVVAMRKMERLEL